jgi:hypothetical protein
MSMRQRSDLSLAASRREPLAHAKWISARMQ